MGSASGRGHCLSPREEEVRATQPGGDAEHRETDAVAPGQRREQRKRGRADDHAAQRQEARRTGDRAGALTDALTDERWDKVIEADTEAALASTGRDVGTPIIRYQPPDGPAFFGPVISRVPDEDEAGPLWDAVLYLAQFPGFAELKRSLRDPPNLPVFGPSPGDEG